MAHTFPQPGLLLNGSDDDFVPKFTKNSQKHDGPKALKPNTKPFFSVYSRAYLSHFAEGLLRFAADEGVGLGTAFQNFDRFHNEFSVAIQFADVALQWPKN